MLQDETQAGAALLQGIPDSAPEYRLFTWADLAARWNCSERTARRRVKVLRVPALRFGHKTKRFRPADVAASDGLPNSMHASQAAALIRLQSLQDLARRWQVTPETARAFAEALKLSKVKGTCCFRGADLSKREAKLAGRKF